MIEFVKASFRILSLASPLTLLANGGATQTPVSLVDEGSLSFNSPPGISIAFTPNTVEQFSSWKESDRLVFTPYFYWYDIWTQAHMLNPDHSDALTTHPASRTGFSYKSKQWHKSQLLDMEAAGIDVMLPVYWGDPSQLRETGPSHWSYAGIPPLVAARDELIAEGKVPPRIGMFYDTTTLEQNQWQEHVDLTTDRGHTWFYESLRDYFSLLPPRHWAMIDHKPIVFTWVSSWAQDYDQEHINFAKSRFSQEFGGRPFYLAKEISWNIEADSVYAWGGAFGLKPLTIASLGPGYDHSNVPDRDPFVVDRVNGEFFQRNWERFLGSGIDKVMIETWNEYHEGTDISNSREHGRQYIEINRHYSDLFKAGVVPSPIDGPFSDSTQIETEFTHPQGAVGIQWIDWTDGKTSIESEQSTPCRSFESGSNEVSYMYFKVHDSFRWQGTRHLKLVVIAQTSINSVLDVEFHGSDESAPFHGAYTLAPRARPRPTSESSTQKRFEFQLNAAKFLNGQNGGADFRLRKLRGDICVLSVTVLKEPSESSSPLAKPTLTIVSHEKDRVTLSLKGIPGGHYLMESSMDLNAWLPLSSINIEEDQTQTDIEVSVRFTSQFFRVSTTINR
jgi:hypothetical protein